VPPKNSNNKPSARENHLTTKEDRKKGTTDLQNN
jgi:hypothetical protein